MGGLAVVVDWVRPVAARELDPMLALTPHRATGGTRRTSFEHAAMAETFFTQDAPDHPAVTSLGHLSIVGDLRLWNRDGLRARAGGNSVTTGLDDRRLLLSSYQRTGIDFLDDVDGDFAFVIWDNRERRAIAVRDRFGAKPLFFERTATGIRFASEVKQLVATSVQPGQPCLRSVSEHLTHRYVGTRMSFFESVERVRPSMALIADPQHRDEFLYWNPGPETVLPTPAGDAAEGFREHLVESVRRRLADTNTAVAHVTGGHDSSSVTAAAHVLADRDRLPSMLHTVSAVFPGHPNDETPWINEIAARQPFPHHDFVPAIETVERYEADMWESDTPRPAPIDGLWAGTIETAHAVGADLVLTGDGGDEVLDQFSLLTDLLRRGSLARWMRGIRASASWSDQRLDHVLTGSVRSAIPIALKQRIRSMLTRSDLPSDALIRRDAWEHLQTRSVEENPTRYGFDSPTQNLVIAYTRAPRLTQILEYEEARHARAGLAVTHPFLDRTLVEYVASIPVTDRPFDGRTKTLARVAFADWLPRSVLDRRTATYANRYLDTIVARLQPHFRNRFPTVTDAAVPFLDPETYASRLADTVANPPVWGDGLLWSAWTLMAWLDRLDRYELPSGRSVIP